MHSSFAIIRGATNNDMRCNVFIDVGAFGGTSWGSGSVADYNAFFNAQPYTTENVNHNHNVVFRGAGDARQLQCCFYRRQWTGPERVCIPNGRPTTSSPHVGACDNDLGSRSGIGINDTTN